MSASSSSGEDEFVDTRQFSSNSSLVQEIEQKLHEDGNDALDDSEIYMRLSQNSGILITPFLHFLNKLKTDSLQHGVYREQFRVPELLENLRRPLLQEEFDASDAESGDLFDQLYVRDLFEFLWRQLLPEKRQEVTLYGKKHELKRKIRFLHYYETCVAMRCPADEDDSEHNLLRHCMEPWKLKIGSNNLVSESIFDLEDREDDEAGFAVGDANNYRGLDNGKNRGSRSAPPIVAQETKRPEDYGPRTSSSLGLVGEEVEDSDSSSRDEFTGSPCGTKNTSSLLKGLFTMVNSLEQVMVYSPDGTRPFYNVALVNFYEDPQDSINFHSDKGTGHDCRFPVVMLSLGNCDRKFKWKPVSTTTSGGQAAKRENETAPAAPDGEMDAGGESSAAKRRKKAPDGKAATVSAKMHREEQDGKNGIIGGLTAKAGEILLPHGSFTLFHGKFQEEFEHCVSGEILLPHGSFTLFHGKFQEEFEHCVAPVPENNRVKGKDYRRISITFRCHTNSSTSSSTRGSGNSGMKKS
ncbi:unnamed protein product [Amoebophrya sp. A120]|nr:unnamed protein product [Amoebophrya sp. A120]|eukprot:GSA120T00004543001.1